MSLLTEYSNQLYILYHSALNECCLPPIVVDGYLTTGRQGGWFGDVAKSNSALPVAAEWDASLRLLTSETSDTALLLFPMTVVGPRGWYHDIALCCVSWLSHSSSSRSTCPSQSSWS